jgi:hypothetical protein
VADLLLPNAATATILQAEYCVKRKSVVVVVAATTARNVRNQHDADVDVDVVVILFADNPRRLVLRFRVILLGNTAAVEVVVE